MDQIHKRIIGMTGGMGAGKSTLIKVITEAGIPVFDFDAEVHELYRNTMIVDHIGSLLGIKERGLTRKDISNEITRRPFMLGVVEQFMMTHLNSALEQRISAGFEPFLVIDAPMLFEMGWDKHVDKVIAILCPREIREERVLQRPGMTYEKMTLFMDLQMSEADRQDRSHYFVDNNGSIDDAKATMRHIIQNLKEFYS